MDRRDLIGHRSERRPRQGWQEERRATSSSAADTVGAVSLLLRRLDEDDDLAAMGRIVLSAYRAVPGHPADADYDAELEDVAARVRDGVVFGAFDAVAPLGCVTYVNDASSPHAEGLSDGEASFRMLAVTPDAQGRGVGEALVRLCLDSARSRGRSAVFIYSGEWMTKAHGLYQRLGFARVVERDWVLSDLGFTLLGFRHQF